MSSVVISGDTSGAITLAAPAVAGTNTITLPALTGTAVVGSSAVSAAGQIPFSTNGTSYTPTAKIVSGTTVATTSGTAIALSTTIPSWVKRITVMFNGVSVSGTSTFILQIGSGSYTTTGYSASTVQIPAGGSGTATTGFPSLNTGAGNTYSGHYVLTTLGSNIWVGSATIGLDGNTYTVQSTGRITLGGTLDRIQLTTVNGTDTFDAGSINILYE
jgi:hypothetical protein